MSYMEKKYELTDETIEVNGKTLYRPLKISQMLKREIEEVL